MFNPKNLMNEYHKLQQYEQEVQRANANSPYPPLPPTSSKRDSPSFNPIQLLAYLSQLDITNPPPGLKNALSNPIVLVGIVIFLWLLIGLLTKLVFIAVIGGGLYFLLKGTGGNGGAGPTEDVVGHRPSFQHQPSSSNQSPYPSPGVGGNSNQQQPSQDQQPKDLASYLWQKGVPAGVELAQTFLNKRTRQAATREARTTTTDEDVDE